LRIEIPTAAASYLFPSAVVITINVAILRSENVVAGMPNIALIGAHSTKSRSVASVRVVDDSAIDRRLVSGAGIADSHSACGSADSGRSVDCGAATAIGIVARIDVTNRCSLACCECSSS
jgi:hypothetical protein